MVAGQYGHLSPAACENAVSDHDGTSLKVRIVGTSGDMLTMTAYAGLDVVRLEGTAAASSDQWVTKAEARTTWDTLIGCGYRKVVEETV
jgi:azurin